MTDKELAQALADALDSAKALDVKVYNIKGRSSITDFTVVATGNSAPHLRALIRDADNALNKLGIRSVRQSGDPESGWMLLDYINVIVHVFSPEARIYYDIEKFWETAEAVS